MIDIGSYCEKWYIKHHSDTSEYDPNWIVDQQIIDTDSENDMLAYTDSIRFKKHPDSLNDHIVDWYSLVWYVLLARFLEKDIVLYNINERHKYFSADQRLNSNLEIINDYTKKLKKYYIDDRNVDSIPSPLSNLIADYSGKLVSLQYDKHNFKFIIHVNMSLDPFDKLKIPDVKAY